MPKTPVIEIKNLTKHFYLGKNPVKAVNGIDLKIYSGEFIILFGPSGCGKSTLLNLVAGLEMPTSGTMLVRGEDLARLKKGRLSEHRRVKIGMVFQQFNLIKSLNAVKNVALPQVFGNVSRGRRVKRAEELLESFGLAKQMRRYPTELSGGEQQRVAIARALINNPWILLVDEPTGNVDSKTALDIMEIFKNLNKVSRRTILLVTHNPEYLHYADRIVYMRDGQKIKEEVGEMSEQEKKEISFSREVNRLTREYTREQLNELAAEVGLHGESFKNEKQVAMAILEAKEKKDIMRERIGKILTPPSGEEVEEISEIEQMEAKDMIEEVSEEENEDDKEEKNT